MLVLFFFSSLRTYSKKWENCETYWMSRYHEGQICSQLCRSCHISVDFFFPTMISRGPDLYNFLCHFLSVEEFHCGAVVGGSEALTYVLWGKRRAVQMGTTAGMLCDPSPACLIRIFMFLFRILKSILYGMVKMALFSFYSLWNSQFLLRFLIKGPPNPE